MNLVIVESPTKSKTLKQYLGDDYIVDSSMGHIRDLPKSKLGVDVEKDFKPSYVLSKGKGKVVKALQDAAQKASIVYLAMDPDREGEAIAFHVKHVVNKGTNTDTKFKRVTFHEITKDAILEAMKKPTTIDLKLVNAQQARRVIDRLVGYTLSPVLWKKVRRGLSAGRVQSVALRLIVEREQEINAFKPVNYWDIKVEVEGKSKNRFWVDLISINGKKSQQGNFLVSSGKDSDSLVADLKKSSYAIESVIRNERKSSPFPPFTTSTLQQAAANVFGWSAKQTMGVAQRLYEQGHITYHRTDSFTLSKKAIDKARAVIKAKYSPQYLPEAPRLYKTKSKNAQEAHEAIRPTAIDLDDLEANGKITAQHKRLYRLVWQRTVASQMSDAIYDATTINVLAKNGKKEFGLRTNGSIRKFDGWRVLFKNNKDDVVLPIVEEGEDLDYKDISSDKKETQPPARFNDASLVKAMEELGIGRPSTYAPIISTIIYRGYVERKEKRFYATTVGMTVIEFLKKNFDSIIDYEFTASMEDDLDAIARGEKDWVPVTKKFWGPFKKTVDSVEKNAERVKIPVEKIGKKCPECKEGELVIRTGRFGKFISCSRFPDCKHTDKLVEKVKGQKCEKCKIGDVVVKKTRKGRMFYGCSRYPKCDWASWTKPGLEDSRSKAKESK
jgi:DNA topoisomerase-1